MPHRLGASGAGAIDRRARRQAWAQDDAARLAGGQAPRGRIELRVLTENAKEEHHG